MIKLNNQRFKYTWLYIIGILLLIATIIWGCHSPIITSQTDREDYEHLDKNWSQIIDGEAVPLDNIKNFISVPQGEKLVFTRTLSGVNDEKALLFYSNNQEVVATVDGEIIQEFVMQKGYEILKTPGSAWNQIDFYCDMDGKELTLSFYSPISSYNNHLNDIYFVDKTDVDSVRFKYIAFRAVVAFFLLILMIIFFSSSIMWKNIQRKRYFFAIGQYYFFALVILLSGISFFDLLFGRPILSYLVGQLFTRLLPVALWRLVVNSLQRFRYPKFMQTLRMLVVLDVFSAIILQFVFGVSFLETLWTHNVVLLVIMLSLAVMGMFKLFRFSKLESDEYPSLPLGFIFLGGILDLVFAFVFPGMQVFGGFSSVICNVLFVTFVYVMLVKEDSKIEQEKRELEKSYKKLKNVALLKQINVHFIFNTLNTISAFCKEDPKEADRAIVVFSDYLRTYIDEVTEEENVHILDEVDLVENYLEIEKMRFGDVISFELNIKYDNFYIPPFTLQTLVENSIKHGLRKTNRKGKITVTTLREGDFAKVIIEDTGEGFDVDKTVSETSVGIKNTKSRIEMLTGGTLDIESEIGIGTKVIIKIPRNGDEENIDDL